MTGVLTMTRLGGALAAAVALLGLAQPAFAQASPSSFTTATRYDAARRVVGTIAADPDGAGALKHAAVRNVYDAAGRLVRVDTGQLASWQAEDVAPNNWSGFTIFKQVETRYDTMSRKVLESVIDVPAFAYVSQTEYTYDALGRLDCTIVRMNAGAFYPYPQGCVLGTQGANGPDRITRQVYDAAGQVLKVQKAYGTPLQQDFATYEYTPNGKQKAVIDANGNRAEMAWDGHDRQATWRFPDKVAVGVASASDEEAYGYDANGNRTFLKKRDNRVIYYAYDAQNRVVSKTYSSGARNVYYGYDLRGLQTAARFDGPGGGDAVTSAWDGFGRQTATTTSMGGVSRTLTFGFDANGNRTSVGWADGASFTYAYDGLDRVSRVREGPVYDLHGISYDAKGVPSASGLRAGAGTDSTGYSFDGLGRLTGRTTAFASDPGYAYYMSDTFGYNPASQLNSRSRSNDAYAFTGYLNVSRGYARNGLNQYTQAGI